MCKPFSSVLLVDDDEITNFINEEIVNGYIHMAEIHTLNDGLEALDYINKHWSADSDNSHRLLFLDINMSNMDGFELLEKTSHIPNMVVVILTTSQHKRDKELAEKFNVFAYMEKPLTPEKLQQLLKPFASEPNTDLDQ